MVNVITGGTSGIGRAIVEKLLKESKCEDDVVIVNYGHNEKAAEEMLSSLGEPERKKVRLIKADLSSYDEMIGFKNRVLEISQTVDRLILNTGIGTYEKFENYTFELWTKVMNTNLSVPVFLVKELKDHMADNGRILLMGSMMGHYPHSTSMAYGVSKAGLQFFGQAVVKEFDGTNVTVNVVCPGFTETPWHKNRTQESYDRINKKIALHRFGAPEEIAELCFAVLSNDYINGSVIDIHGGYNYF